MLLFLHGSYKPLDVGTTLTPRGDAYEADWGKADFYQALERHRPEYARSHKDSVFLTLTCEAVELAGGYSDYIFLVEPEDCSNITRHDQKWLSAISCLMDSHDLDSPQIKKAADNYWSGIPHPDDPDEPLWEYLCSGASIRVVSDDPSMDDAFDQMVADSHLNEEFAPANHEGSPPDRSITRNWSELTTLS